MHKSEMELEEQILAQEEFGKIAVHIACQLAVLQARHCQRMQLDLQYLLSKQQYHVYSATQSAAELPDLSDLVDLVSQLKGELHLQGTSQSRGTFVCILGNESERDEKERELVRLRKLAYWVGGWSISRQDIFVLISLTHAFAIDCYDLPLLVELGRLKGFDLRVDVCVDGRPVDQQCPKAAEPGKRRRFPKRGRDRR